MEVRLLGSLEVVDGDGRSIDVKGKGLRRLLGILALQPNEVVSADRIIETLWGENQPQDPRGALYVLVSRLRRAVGEVLVTRDGGYVLRLSPDDLDVFMFERRLGEGARASVAGMHELAMERLQAGLALWRGDGSHELLDLGKPEVVTGWDEMRKASQELLAESELSLGRHREIVGELERLVAAEPFREHRWTLLMLALYRSGRQREALSAYQTMKSLLGEELGIEPGDEARGLEERILLQDPYLAWKPISAETRQLPAQLTSFIGRDKELAQLADLIRRVRVVSVLGAGGVGKTRLSLKAAEEVAGEMSEGVRFVPLVTQADPVLVPHAVARGLGIPEDARISPTEALATYLRDKEVLLLLDNCEHLVKSVGVLVRDLVSSCPNLRVLTTSRQPLTVPGEASYVLDPLDGEDAAVRLFIDRAEMAKPGFAAGAEESVVRQICSRLDGLPLAIELAASRVRLMELSEINAWLDRQFELLTGGSGLEVPHHTTLRATFDWSYELLTDEQKMVFRRLSVFRGGITPSTAEDHSGLSFPLQSLFSLADQSLLLMRQGRFDMLETVREYARQRLRYAGEEEEALRSHATLFAQLAESTDAELLGKSQLESVDTLEQEHDNIRAALSRSFEFDPSQAAQIAASMGQFWFMRGYFDEGRTWLAKALSVEIDDAVKIRLDLALAQMAWYQFDLDGAERFSQEAQSLAEATGDSTHLGVALDLRGRVALGRGNYDLAQSLLETALAHLEESEANAWLADCYHWLGHIARYEGRLADGLANHRQAKSLFLACGDIRGAAYATGGEGRDLLVSGDIEPAISAFRDSMELAAQLGDRQIAAVAGVILAWILAFHSELDATAHQEAIILYRVGLADLLEVGDLGALAEVLEGAVPLLIELEHETDAAKVWGAALNSHVEFAVPEVLRADRRRMEEILEGALGPDFGAQVELGRSWSIAEATRLTLKRFEEAVQMRSGESRSADEAGLRL